MPLQPKMWRYVRKISEILCMTGFGVVVIMMLATVTDVIGQNVGHPFNSIVGWTEIFNVICIALPMVYVTLENEHVICSLITFRGRVKSVVGVVNLFLTFSFMILLAWQLAIQAWRSTLALEGELIATKIYWFPGKIALAVGFIGSVIVLLLQIVDELQKLKEVKKPATSSQHGLAK